MPKSKGVPPADPAPIEKPQAAVNISEPAIRQYCDYMEAVKQGMAAIASMGSQPIRELLPGEIQVESIYLQFRKILELIAMGSLFNNKAEYAKARADFDKDWNARRILNNLAKVNPEFYPKPVIDEVIDEMPVLRPASGALTRSDFEQLYDRCGEILHTANPFGNRIDYKKLSGEITGWLGKIVALLNQHQVHLLGEDGFWLIQMTTTTSDRVHYSRFEPEIRK